MAAMVGPGRGPPPNQQRRQAQPQHQRRAFGGDGLARHQGEERNGGQRQPARRRPADGDQQRQARNSRSCRLSTRKNSNVATGGQMQSGHGQHVGGAGGAKSVLDLRRDAPPASPSTAVCRKAAAVPAHHAINRLAQRPVRGHRRAAGGRGRRGESRRILGGRSTITSATDADAHATPAAGSGTPGLRVPRNARSPRRERRSFRQEPRSASPEAIVDRQRARAPAGRRIVTQVARSGGGSVSRSAPVRARRAPRFRRATHLRIALISAGSSGGGAARTRAQRRAEQRGERHRQAASHRCTGARAGIAAKRWRSRASADATAGRQNHGGSGAGR